MTSASKAAKIKGPPKAAAAAPIRVRDRIFESACDLFYRNGIHKVCVESIATEAGSNKMSFYRNFASKEELVAEYLNDQVKDYWAWWDAAIAPYAGDARRQLEALFDAYTEKSLSSSVSGCALGNAALELREESHPGFAIARGFKAEMRRRLRALARAAGAAKPNQLGDGLLLIMEGGYLTRITFVGNDGPFAVAATVARVLLDAHLS
jgi:AcrR family transcriptional regulator